MPAVNSKANPLYRRGDLEIEADRIAGLPIDERERTLASLREKGQDDLKCRMYYRSVNALVQAILQT